MQATINGLDTHYEITGSGPWITLSHSLACSSEMWKPQIEVLKAHFTVLCYDTRGHGKTQATPGPYTLEQLADDAHGLLAHLKIEKTHWMGLSMGGMIGQVLAIRHPECLDKVIIADSTGKAPPNGVAMWEERAVLARSKGMAALVEPTLGRWFTQPFHQSHPQVLKEIGALIAATPVEGYAACCAAIGLIDNLEGITKLHHPALIMVGDQDFATPIAASEAIHKNWNGSKLTVIKDAAHLSNLEQVKVYNETVVNFLRG